MDTTYTHICEGVIISLNQHTDALGCIIANDIYTHNITIRRAAISAVLNVDTQHHALYRGVANNRLATTINRQALCYARAIDNTAIEIVITTRRTNIIRSILTAQTYHSLIVRPTLGSLDNGVIRKLQSHALCRLGRGYNRLRNKINTIGEIYRAIGIFVDYLLYGVADISLTIRLYIDHNISLLCSLGFCSRQISQRKQTYDCQKKIYYSSHSGKFNGVNQSKCTKKITIQKIITTARCVIFFYRELFLYLWVIKIVKQTYYESSNYRLWKDGTRD